MKRSARTATAMIVMVAFALPLSAQEKTAGKAAKAEKPAHTGIEVVEIEPFFYAAVEMAGSYEQHGQAFMMLMGAAGQQGIPMNEAPFGIYHNSPEETPEEELKWEVGLPLQGEKELAAPIVLKKWEHTTVAQRDFEGAIDSDEMQAVYMGMYEWITANGYELAGPMLERFLSMPSPNEKGETVGKVQIVFPVQKKLPAPSGVKLN